MNAIEINQALGKLGPGTGIVGGLRVTKQRAMRIGGTWVYVVQNGDAQLSRSHAVQAILKQLKERD